MTMTWLGCAMELYFEMGEQRYSVYIEIQFCNDGAATETWFTGHTGHTGHISEAQKSQVATGYCPGQQIHIPPSPEVQLTIWARKAMSEVLRSDRSWQIFQSRNAFFFSFCSQCRGRVAGSVRDLRLIREVNGWLTCHGDSRLVFAIARLAGGGAVRTRSSVCSSR